MNIPLKQYWTLLINYLKPQWRWAALLAVLLLGNIGLQLVNPQIMRHFIDTAQSGGDLQALLRVALLFIGIALVQQVVSVLATYTSENVGWTATNALRADLAQHCLRLDMSFHNARTPGEMIERLDGDVTALSDFFSQFVIQVVGNALLLVGVLVLSLSTLFVRWAEAPGMVTSFYRMAVATLAVAPFFWRRWVSRRAAERGLGAQLRIYGPALLAGVLSALDHATVSSALAWTAVANATLLNNLAPVWVALFAVLVWRQRLGGRFWVGLVLACVGAAIVLGNGGLRSASVEAAVLGDAVALLSSVFYAAYLMTGERARRGLDTLGYVWPMTATAGLALLAGCLVLGHPLTGYPTTTYLVFLGAGLISQVVGYFAVGYALGHLSAAVVSATLLAQPVVTALLAIPLAGEGLGVWRVLGGVGVLGGIWLVVASQERIQSGQRTA